MEIQRHGYMTQFSHAIATSKHQNTERLLRKCIPYFLTLIFIATLLDAYTGYVAHNGWKMGDWLINYQGGMIRRGLLGELFYQLSQFTQVNPGFYVFLFQVLFYAIFFIFSYQLLIRQHHVWPYILLIFSPFIFTFQINDLQGGYRKEVIYFALLAFIAYAAKTLEHKVFERILYLALLLYPAIILTHEMLAIFLPYLLVVYASVTDLTKKRIWIISCLLVPSIISFLVCIAYPVAPSQTTAILQSLTQAGYPIDSGAIAWLNIPTSYAVNEVIQITRQTHYFAFYVLVLLLALIAYLPLRKHLSFIFHKQLSLFLVTISITGTIALCFIALDWGRFIYIHLVSLFIVSLIASPSVRVDKKNEKCPLFNNTASRLFVVFFFTAYALLWHIPHCCSPAPYAHNYHQINAVAYIQPYINLLGVKSK